VQDVLPIHNLVHILLAGIEACATSNTSLLDELNFWQPVYAFWILTPFAPHIATFQENGSADSRPIVYRETLYIRYHTLCHMQITYLGRLIRFYTKVFFEQFILAQFHN
jgi:hypothetical protein